MSVSVDNVVSAMLTAGGEIILHKKNKIASKLGVPTDVSSPWFMAHSRLEIDSDKLFTMILGWWVGLNGRKATIDSIANITLQMDLVSVAEAISELGNFDSSVILQSTQEQEISNPNNIANSKTNALPFGVKSNIREFVGRIDELKKLNNYFMNPKLKCVVIYAIGGQGKTELCRKFIQDLISSNSPAPVVIWLQGESIKEFTSSLSLLALFLFKSNQLENLLPLLKSVAKHIKHECLTHRWLVVVDNVDEEYPELDDIIRIFNEFQAFVLITSRKNDIFPGETTPLALETLSSSDAMILARNSLKDVDEEEVEDVEPLCDNVGNHAHVIRQSVSYIRTQKRTNKAYGISHFLQEFQSCKRKILQHPVRLSDYKHTFHSIIRTTLDSISKHNGKIGQTAGELWTILGLIIPNGVHLDVLQKLRYTYIENRPKSIPQSLVRWYRRLLDNEGKATSHPSRPSTSNFSQMTINYTREAVLLLAKFSMVSLNGDVVSIHRLVQMVLRLEFENEQTINILLKHIHPKNSPLDELRQIISIWEHADHEAVKNNPGFALQIFNRMTELSLVLELSGFAEKNHTLLCQLLGPNHEETLNMGYSAAGALYEMGDRDVALTRLETLLERKKSVWEGNIKKL